LSRQIQPYRGDFKGERAQSRIPDFDGRPFSAISVDHGPQRQGDDMTIKVGDKLPSVTISQGTSEGPRPVSTEEFFKGRTVALFALPGAFTPTCSAKHLPGFKQLAPEMKAKGVDVIACLSVNDAFVMKAWGEDQAVGEDIVMLADGNGDFTTAIGLEMDGSKFGMGKRSQRYSMIVKDGVVKELNVEQGGEFKVSAADYLLAQL
jgi:peroxiredoxin